MREYLMSLRGVLGAVCLVLAGLAPVTRGEDWPRWGGPRGDETWRGPKLRADWPQAGLTRVWRRDLGGGYGGIAVAAGRGFVLDRQTEPAERERLLCFDAATGESVWEFDYPVEYGKLDYGNGPRSTPTVDGEHVYTLGALGMLACLETATGRLVWQRDLRAADGAVIPTWGLAASPVIWGDLVIVHPGVPGGGCVMAFDRRSGVERWRCGDDPAGYATPALIDAPAGPQLVCWSPEHVLGIDPASGKLAWMIPYKVTYGVSIATPIYRDGLVFVTGYWEGSKAIRLGNTPAAAELAWEENRNLRGLMAQPIEREGHVYSIDKQFGLTCFELSTGAKKWDCGNKVVARGRNPQATLTWLEDGDRAILLNESGDLILARLNPQGYQELARTSIIARQEGSPIWAHPAYAGSRVYARSDSELVCVELPVAAR